MKRILPESARALNPSISALYFNKIVNSRDDRNNLYFWDYGHLTKEGSLFLASKIEQIHSNQ